MREEFIAACAAVDTETCQILTQLRGSIAAGLAGVAAPEAIDGVVGLHEASDAAAAGMANTVVVV